MSSEQNNLFRLPRLSHNRTQITDGGVSPRACQSFLTSPTKDMLLTRTLSTQKLSQPISKSKFKLARNYAAMEQSMKQADKSKQSEEELSVQKQLHSIENQQLLLEDQKPHQLVGTHAVRDFYQHYKKLTRVLEENRLNGLPNSPYTAILENSQKLNILPACYGMIRTDGSRNVLKLANYKLGDKYSRVVSSGLREMKDVDEYLFGSNRLTDKGFSQVLASVNADAVKLDFSNNRIHSFGPELMHLLTNIDSRLQHLNLENNKLGDAAMNNLTLAVNVNRTLRYLNLRRNFLTKNSCDNLTTIVEKTKNLEELYLGWVPHVVIQNKLNGAATRTVFQKLSKNSTIAVLDFSNNGLGQLPAISEAVAQLLNKNTKIVHLDLSYNNIPLTECQPIAEALKENHSVYGMHFAGNCGYINHQGFLVFDQVGSYDALPVHFINGLEVCTKRPYARHDFSIRKDVCWLCEGWLEHTLELPAHHPSDGMFALHYSFDGFRKTEYSLKNKDGKIKVMLPPGEVRIYYTMQDTQGCLANYPTQLVPGIEIPSSPEQPQHDLLVNVIKSHGKSIVTDEEYKEIKTTIVPRSDGQRPKKVKKWNFQGSVWAKEWKGEDNELTRKCFETDWQHSKISNLVKNPGDQAQVKQLLHQNYRKIKEIYRYYAAWSPFGDVWAVGMNPFTQFCNQAKLICKELPSKIVDLTFITTNSMSGADWKGNHQVPERGLTRFQFMESLVRLADEKYRKNGLFQQMSECINAMLNDHIKPLYRKFTAESWRTQTYFTEHNDALIKLYRPVFKDIYKRNSKMKVRPGDKPFMCLDEFKDICQRAGLFLPGCAVERDCMVNFNASMITQVDELTSERIYRMTEIEFIEALARMSEYLIIPSLEGGGKLHHRFEQLIVELTQRVSSEEIRGQFPPGPSIFQIDADTTDRN